MIDVRARVTFSSDHVFWTAPIRNHTALRYLVMAYRQRGVQVEVFDDTAHAEIAQSCFDLCAEAGDHGWLEWGPPGGKKIYRVEVAKLPIAAGLLAGQLKPAKCSSCDEDEPRELRGPTDEEVAQCTPFVRYRDHGGDRASRPESVAFGQQAAKRVSWIDRLMAWVTGAPKGSEVRK